MGTLDVPENRKKLLGATEDSENEDEEAEVCRRVPIPCYRWVMNGAVMFGREFCYAMETALVTPVLLRIDQGRLAILPHSKKVVSSKPGRLQHSRPTPVFLVRSLHVLHVLLWVPSRYSGFLPPSKDVCIGLPKQYYSLTWFLSPILGLFFTPVIGSASDRCSLRLGRRRPFILALSVGALLGVGLFLNGAFIGLSVGDTPGSQPIGIVLTVLGVIVLDFCADAADGLIRAYLLDVADTEEQDMALNIHAFSAGLGGALGYMLGGLDWTGTALGRAFKSQEQVLFLFAGIIFIISVTLHMFSIPEKPLRPQQLRVTESAESTRQSSLRPGYTPSLLDVIAEEASCREDNKTDSDEEDMDILALDRVRSKSDSVLAMPDATIELDPDLQPDNQHFFREVEHCLPEAQEDLDDVFKPSDCSFASSIFHHAEDTTTSNDALAVRSYDATLCPENGPSCSLRLRAGPGSKDNKSLAVNGANNGLSTPNIKKGPTSPKLGNRPSSTSRPHPHAFYRQPSFTFSYYGRVGSHRHRLKRNAPLSFQPITTSRSLNDITELRNEARRWEMQLSVSSLSSEGSSSLGEAEGATTVRLLWLSMLKMPKQLWRLCVCHLLTWFSIIAEAVFYTDFMGQVIYHGDPTAPANSTELHNYLGGVQMGCWGLVVYAATAAICSAILQKYLDNFDLSIKVIYIVGTLGFSVGTAVMAIFPNVYIAMVMISSMGVFSMSISYCPYALLGQYHEINEYIYNSPENTRRGFGIDCAILTCQVYISQILVASALGAVVEAVGSVRVIPAVASGGSFLGFLAACFLVIYPDVEPTSSEQDQEVVEVTADQNGDKNSQRLALLNLTNIESVKKLENHSAA